MPLKTVLLSLFFAFVTAQGRAEIASGHYYNLVSNHSNKCLDLLNHGTENGVQLQQWECTGEPHQVFRAESSANGSIKLVGAQSGRCIDVAEYRVENGSRVQQWDCSGQANQDMFVSPSAHDSVKLKFAHSSKCLDVSGPSVENGAIVHQWECVNQANQDWQFVEVNHDGGKLNNVRALIDNSDEATATVKLFNARNVQSVVVRWNIYNSGVAIQTLDTTTRDIDLTRLGQHAGYELGAIVIVDGQFIESENKILLSEVVKGPLHAETITAEKPGLGLLGRPIVRRINFTFETYQVGCKSKTVISTKGIYKEEECDYRNRPKDFNQVELSVLKAAAITAFKSLMADGNNGTNRLVTQCAINAANNSHGEFQLAAGVALDYTSANAAAILETQLAKWDIFGNTQDFNIHFRVNYSSKPDSVIAHANVGQVLDNFEHDKFNNTNRNRFEIHVARQWLPPTPTTTGTATWHDDDGVAYTNTTSLRFTAGTIAHEMMHQLGLRHTQNAKSDDFQDDFVYEVGDCVEQNFISDFGWNDTAAF